MTILRTTICAAAIAAIGAVRRRPAAARPDAPATAELPTLSVSHWTDKTELFMEHPPLVAGAPPGWRCTSRRWPTSGRSTRGGRRSSCAERTAG